MGIYSEKIQCQFRLLPSDYEKIKELAKEYGLTFQKVSEILVLNFMRGNKDAINIIQKYAEQKKERKGKTFDDTERSSILDKIEKEGPYKF